MANAKVRLRGRFPAGTIVRLIEVDGEHVLRAEGGREVDTKKVNDDGEVTFSAGVKENGRYFVVGLDGGVPREVRVRGRADADDDAVNAQAPVQRERQRLSDGTFVDEVPEQRDAPKFEAAPHLAQDQAGDVVQRSSTPRGTAHPVDTDEQTPYPRQEDVKKGVVQMSHTETGEATPIEVGFQRQEDVPKGVWQRSDTPTGVATPLPTGGAVEAQRSKESSEAKAKRGDWTRAAAEPIDKAKPVKGASEKQSDKREEDASPEAIAERVAEARPDATDGNTSGHDAEGQPASADVAAAAGVTPAKKSAAAKRSTTAKARSSARKEK